jgi:hypothetical protein
LPPEAKQSLFALSRNLAELRNQNSEDGNADLNALSVASRAVLLFLLLRLLLCTLQVPQDLAPHVSSISSLPPCTSWSRPSSSVLLLLYRLHSGVRRNLRVSRGIVANEDVFDSADAVVVGYSNNDPGGKQHSSEGRRVLHGEDLTERYIQRLAATTDKYKMSALMEET